MQSLILKSEEFIKKNYKNEFPEKISASVMAFFADAILKNKEIAPHVDLVFQAKTFLIEESLEEFNYCIDNFSKAISEFVKNIL